LKKYEIEVEDHVAETIQMSADSLGITEAEQIRYCLGMWARNINPQPMRIPVIKVNGAPLFGGPSSEPSTAAQEPQMPPEIEAMHRLSLWSMKKAVKAGDIHCKRCTMALTWEAIEKNECQNCGEKDPLEEVG
jgi:hypothetical protein